MWRTRCRLISGTKTSIDTAVNLLLCARNSELSRGYSQGTRVGTRPELRYILIRRRTSGHGHVAVYRVRGQDIDVLHEFHTSQDWQGMLSTKQP